MVRNTIHVESVFIDSHIIIWLTIIYSIKCSIVSRPKDTITSVGEINIRLKCSTNLQYSMIWQYAPVGSSKSEEISFGDVIDKALEARYQIDKTIPGHYDLVFPKVDIPHAGRYSCHDNEGDDLVGASAELIVILNSKVNCSSNETDNFCYVEFCGNFKPLWTDGKLCYDDSKKSDVCPSLTVINIPSKLELQNGLLETCDRNKQLNCTCISTFGMINEETATLRATELTKDDDTKDGKDGGSASSTLIAVIVPIVILIAIIIIGAAIFKSKGLFCRHEEHNSNRNTEESNRLNA